jgi:hypothetical protein
MLMMQGTA